MIVQKHLKKLKELIENGQVIQVLRFYRLLRHISLKPSVPIDPKLRNNCPNLSYLTDPLDLISISIMKESLPPVPKTPNDVARVFETYHFWR